MQCKDIPDIPILKFVAGQPIWGTWFAGFDNSVDQAMPKDVPPKLVHAKMNMLLRRGVIDGCPCGCRGDYEITEKGKREIERGVD